MEDDVYFTCWNCGSVLPFGGNPLCCNTLQYRKIPSPKMNTNLACILYTELCQLDWLGRPKSKFIQEAGIRSLPSKKAIEKFFLGNKSEVHPADIVRIIDIKRLLENAKI